MLLFVLFLLLFFQILTSNFCVTVSEEVKNDQQGGGWVVGGGHCFHGPLVRLRIIRKRTMTMLVSLLCAIIRILWDTILLLCAIVLLATTHKVYEVMVSFEYIQYMSWLLLATQCPLVWHAS